MEYRIDFLLNDMQLLGFFGSELLQLQLILLLYLHTFVLFLHKVVLFLLKILKMAFAQILTTVVYAVLGPVVRLITEGAGKS